MFLLTVHPAMPLSGGLGVSHLHDDDTVLCLHGLLAISHAVLVSHAILAQDTQIMKNNVAWKYRNA